MKNSLLLICALILSYGCSDDDAPVIATGTFESTAMIKNDPVILYTKDKTITDTAFLRAFLERNQATRFFDLTAGMAPPSIYVVFDNRVADSVYFKYFSDFGDMQLILNQVYYNNNTAIYVGRDSLPTSAAEDGELSCSNVSQHIRLYPLLTDCAPSIPLGYWSCKARYQVPVIMNGNEISIPITSYYFYNQTSFSSCRQREKYALGQFNEDALKTIHKDDTLVVQRRVLALEKK